MTNTDIANGTRKAVKDNADIQISVSVDWLVDYGLISWRHRNAILNGISKARKIAEKEAAKQADGIYPTNSELTI